MKHIAPFKLNVPPIHGECATSLAARIAQRNGIGRLVAFCSDVGMDYLSLANGDPDSVRLVARFAGQEPEPLLYHTPSLTDEDWFLLGNENVKFSAFSRSKPNACPVCLSNAPQTVEQSNTSWQRGYWQLRSIRCCHEHNCLLQSLPKPETPKDHFDAAFLGQDHTFAPPEIVDPKDTAFERYLVSRIEGATAQTWLDKLPFHVAALTTEAFGLLLTNGPKAKRAQTSAHDWLRGGLAGYKVLLEGPEAFNRQLAEIASSYPPAHAKYRAQFGVFFEWLRYMDDDHHFDIIRDIVREFVVNNYPVATGSMVLGQEAPTQRLYNLEALVKEAPRKRAFLTHKLYERGYMEVASRPGRYGPKKYVGHRDKFFILSEVYQLRNLKQAARNLGVSEAVVKDLTKHGLLKRYFTHKGAVVAYHTNELWGFYCRVTNVWKPAHHKGLKTNRILIRDAARKCRCSLWQALALIIEHKILITKPDRKAKGIDALRVNPKHIDKALDRAAQQITSFREAAQALETDAQTICAMAKKGILERQREQERRPNQRHRAVYTKSLRECIAKYGDAKTALFELKSSISD